MSAPIEPNDERVLKEIQDLKSEVASLKAKDNSYLMGLVQGLLIALIVWYIVTPIAHWSVSSTITFFISTPLIEKIKFWISFPFFFIPPIGFIVILIQMEPKGTIKHGTRLWSYIIIELVLIIYSFNQALPALKQNWFW